MRKDFKAVLLADFHIHHLPAWRLTWCENFVKELLANPDYNDHYLFLLGDVLEIRDRVDSRVLNLLIELIVKWQGEVVWVSGQHDSYLPGRATLEGLNNLSNVHVVDGDVYHHQPTDTWFVPFCRKDDDYRELLKKIPDGAVVFTHLPIVEAIAQFNVKDIQGIELKEFERFEHTYSGDIHTFVDYLKFSYIGAPSQRDWRDKNVRGRIGILENGEFRRVETSHPIHIEVENESEIPDDKQCIVKCKKGISLVNKENVIASVETTSIDLESVELTSTEGTDEQVMQRYVSQQKEELNVDEIIKEGISILGEATK